MNRSSFWTTCLAALVGLVSLAPTASAASVPADRDLLAEAAREYRAALDGTDREERLQHFRQAELLFARLVEGESSETGVARRGVRNPELYVSWGNAALGAQRLGTAVLAYRRALRLDPDHDRARQNLRHARSLLPDWVPRPEEGGLLDTFFSWNTRLSPVERNMAASLTFLAAAALVAAAIRWRRPALRNLALLPGIVWLVLVAGSLLEARQNRDDAAVVTAAEVVARAADSVHAPARLSQPLPSGTEVDIVEQRESFVHIRLTDGRDAWVPRSAVELVGEP